MKVINLNSLEESGIKYKISKFPDGQQDIVLEYNNKDSVQIQSRFNSWLDLELIVATTKALQRLGVEEIHLYIPYLLGARSDRHFQEGGNSYLVDVVAPIINSLNFESVTVLDVHSDVAAACIKNLKSIDNVLIVQDALDFAEDLQEYVIISPDAGALKKIYPVAKALGNSNVVIASKNRDIVTGKITSTEVPLFDSKKDWVIVDDIGDGMRTFIEIAKKVKEFNTGKGYLVITHGIFSAGYEELGKYFDGIYCTNSVKDVADYVTGSNGRYVPTKVKQLKVI